MHEFDPEIILGGSFKSLRLGLILVQNHPLGNVNLTETDIKLTQNIKQIRKDMELINPRIFRCDLNPKERNSAFLRR